MDIRVILNAARNPIKGHSGSTHECALPQAEYSERRRGTYQEAVRLASEDARYLLVSLKRV
jgi:hypothetical protein